MKKLAFILWFLYSIPFLSSQTFRVDVSHTRAQVNERVAIQYSFDGGNLPENILPAVNNMLVVGGPSLMHGSSTINGVTTTSSQLTYEVLFTRPGTYTIPAARIRNKNGKFATQPVTINVVKGANAKPIIPPGYEGKELMIVMEANKKTAYLGEPIAIDLMVYCIFNNVTMSSIDYPTFDGGWTQDATDAYNDQLELASYKGKAYNKWAFKRVWMVPSIIGNIEFKPVAATFRAEVKDPNAGYLQFSYNAKSDPVKFDVIDLPAEHKPASFINAMGNFTWTVQLDKAQAKANEPVKALINITGTGNLPVLEAPALHLPVDFEIFEPQVKNNYQVQIKGINGSKQFSYLIMPRKEGTYWLGPFYFSYFDPTTKKYTELRSDSFQVNIKGVIADTTTSAAQVNNGMFTGSKIYKKKAPFFGHPLYYILLALPFLAGVGMVFFRKRLFFTQKDDSEKKLRLAEEKATRSLAEARSILAAGNAGDALNHLSGLFYQYICDKYKANRSGVTRTNLKQWLPATALPAAVQIMDLLDQFRFAPAAQSDLDSLYNHIQSFIHELGKK